MRVSVIIPTKNRPDRLKCAVESVLNQDYPNMEIVIINDGGQNIAPTLSSIQGLDQAQIINNTESMGPAAARNRGVSASKGEIITYLDDDDLLLPNHLANIANTLSKTCGSKLVYTGATHAWLNQTGDKFVVLTNNWTTEKQETAPARTFSYDDLLVHNFIPLICVAHTRDLFDKAGPFDESLPILEDWELLLRLTKPHGAEPIFQNTAVYQHHKGDAHVNAVSDDAIPTTKRIYNKHPVQDPQLKQKRELHLGRLANAVRLKYRQNITAFDERLKAVKQAIGKGEIKRAQASLNALLSELPNDGELAVLLAKLYAVTGAAADSKRLQAQAEQRDPYFFVR